ncbi:MAG TPA: GNAT family N-acetyltransferase [Pseudolabrys sp.]|nr:GNAT family N-acetyltransferase [Pseudolabrys sp.]
MLVRPLRPEDAALYPDFLTHVTADDLRLRFFAALRELRPELIERLTHLDYATAMAFIAISETTGAMLGVVRLHDDPDGRSAEFAVIVRSALKGHGLGWLLMQRMIEYAKAKRLKRVHGQVLAENTTMLRMCQELGFHLGPDVQAGVKVEVLDLDGVPQGSSQ